MTEALQLEIRTLRALYQSERDPQGRVFAPLADAYRRAGQIPEAVRILNEGLPRHPDFVTGHVVAAQLYVEQGLVEQGAMAARRALELDQENVFALHALLRVLHERGEAEEAAAVRDRLASLDPELAEEALAAAGPAAAATRESASGPPEWNALEPAEPLALEPPGATVDPGSAELAIDLGARRQHESPAAMSQGLAPDPEPVLDLDALGALSIDGIEIPTAPREPSAWDALAPEPVVDEEPVLDIGALAPASLQETTVSRLVAEAEEPVFDIGALAPASLQETTVSRLVAEAEEPVFDIGALAPEPVVDEEPVLDIGALAPEPVVDEEPVLDIGALAPEPVVDEEPVLDIGALAPEPVVDEEPVFDIGALAPEPVVDEEPVLDIGALAPGPVVDEEPVLDIGALAPEPGDSEPVDSEPIFDVGLLAPQRAVARSEPGDEATKAGPDEIVIDLDVLRSGTPSRTGPEGLDQSAPELDADTESGDEEIPLYTRTLAELYVKRGAIDRALAVLHHLREADPGDHEIARRIAELESGVVDSAPPVEPAPTSLPSPLRDVSDDVETLARDLAQGGPVHDVETPFAWEEADAEKLAVGPTIREYFDELLSWERQERP